MEEKNSKKHSLAYSQKSEIMSHKKIDYSVSLETISYNHSISEQARKKIEDFTNDTLQESQQLIEIICKKVNVLLQESKKRLDLIRYLSSSSNPTTVIEQQLDELSNLSLNVDRKHQIRADLVNYFSIRKSESASCFLNSIKKVNEQLEEGNIILHNLQNTNENSILERIKLIEHELYAHREKFEQLNSTNMTESMIWGNIKEKVSKNITRSSDRLFEAFNEAQKVNNTKFETIEKKIGEFKESLSDKLENFNANVISNTLSQVENTYREVINHLGSQAKQNNYFIQMFSNSFEDEDNLIKKIQFTRDKKFIFIGKN